MLKSRKEGFFKEYLEAQKKSEFWPIRPEACNFIKKKTFAQVFSCEFCEISKNTFSQEHLF